MGHTEEVTSLKMVFHAVFLVTQTFLLAFIDIPFGQFIPGIELRNKLE